jgi:TonB family protein
MSDLAIPVAVTANDRLKADFGSRFWGSLLLAALLHFLLLALWPEMEAADVSYAADQLEQVELPREFEIPPPPEQLARPAVPVLSTDVDISEDITIGEVRFEDNPVSELPPPPTGQGVDVSENPVFTPREVEPELKNRPEFGRLLERRYPPMLRDAGVGGTVLLWVYVDESGRARNTRVTQSSGYEQLDALAQELMLEAARFFPALNRDQKVPVWIQMPVTFETR